MEDEVTGELPIEEAPLDPIDEAWFRGELDVVARLAQARLASDPTDWRAHAWLGLALFRGTTVGPAQASLSKAAELLRAAREKTTDDELKAELGWELQGLADRLHEAVEASPSVLAAARFVADELKLEHPPSLRVLVEDVAEREGNPVKAATMLKRALAADPTDAESHYLAARLFARLGRRSNLMGHLKKAVEYAEGAVAVRSLARYEADFDGYRDDEAFAQLVDQLPTEPTLRPLYAALEGGDAASVIQLAAALPQTLDVLQPLRDAHQLAGDEAAAARVQALIDEQEEDESPAYSRFRGER